MKRCPHCHKEMDENLEEEGVCSECGEDVQEEELEEDETEEDVLEEDDDEVESD